MTSRSYVSGRRGVSRRVGLIAMSLVLTVLSLAPPAAAAAPANDGWEDARRIGAIPYRSQQDTSEATKDAEGPDDACSNSREHSVWFRMTPARNREVVISTAGSDYDTVLSVYKVPREGAPLNRWRLVGCDDDGGADATSVVGLGLVADGIYYVMISSFGASDAGALALSVKQPVTMTYSLARRGRVDGVDGSAILHGKVRCSRTGTAVISVGLRQRIGERVTSGWGNRAVRCGTKAVTWRLRVAPSGSWAFQDRRARVSSDELRACEPKGRACLKTYRFHKKVVRLR